MLILRTPNRPDEDLFSVDALERDEALSHLNIRRVAREYPSVGVEIDGRVFVRADRLAAVIGRDADEVATLCALADTDDDSAEGVILPAAASERQALAAARAKRIADTHAAGLSR